MRKIGGSAFGQAGDEGRARSGHEEAAMAISRSDQRAARLRRVWRMALLLRGPGAAAWPIHEAVGRAKGMESIEPVRLERMVVFECRQHRGAGEVARHQEEADSPGSASADAAEAYAALGALPAQAREAWLLRRVEAMDEVAAARTMDCSKTAMNRHLDRAEALLGEAGVDGEAMRGAIERWLDAAASRVPADPRRVARRRGFRRALWAAVGLALAAVAAAIWLSSR